MARPKKNFSQKSIEEESPFSTVNTEVTEDCESKVENFIEENIEENIEKDINSEIPSSVAPQISGPTYNELLDLVKSLAAEVQTLKSTKNENVLPAIQRTATDDKTDRLLDILANKKSDKEVTIVHNCELVGGLSTHIELTGLIIDFHTMGEERLLNWQQFEECVSRYKSFFDRRTILLGENYAELATTYNIPCVKRNGQHTMTHAELLALPTYEPRKLEDYVRSLNDSDKKILCSYWLGQAYQRVDGYYDRIKIEILNRSVEGHIFDNLLTLMNGDYRNN